MEKPPVKFEAVQLAEPVDKLLWEQTLDQVARWIVEECLERERLEANTTGTLDIGVGNNITLDKYGQNK